MKHLNDYSTHIVSGINNDAIKVVFPNELLNRFIDRTRFELSIGDTFLDLITMR